MTEEFDPHHLVAVLRLAYMKQKDGFPRFPDTKYIIPRYRTVNERDIKIRAFPVLDAIASLSVYEERNQVFAVAMQLDCVNGLIRLTIAGNRSVEDKLVNHLTKLWGKLRALSDDHAEKRRPHEHGRKSPEVPCGSAGSANHIRQDPNPADNTYPTGYMGKNNEVSWIQQLAQQFPKEAYKSSPMESLPPGSAATAASGITASSGSRSTSVSDIWVALPLKVEIFRDICLFSLKKHIKRVRKWGNGFILFMRAFVDCRMVFPLNDFEQNLFEVGTALTFLTTSLTELAANPKKKITMEAWKEMYSESMVVSGGLEAILSHNNNSGCELLAYGLKGILFCSILPYGHELENNMLGLSGMLCIFLLFCLN